MRPRRPTTAGPIWLDYLGSWILWAMAFVGILAVSLALSYYRATLGHPGSIWFWRDMLGVAVGG